MITYRPPDNSLYQFFSVPMSQPFNPERVGELLVAGLATINLTIPPVGYLGTAQEDGELGISLPKPVTQQELDAATAVLTAVANDPTRNDLTEEEQERADIQNKIGNMNAAELQLAGDNDADPVILGIIDYLASERFEADNPTNAGKIEALRSHARSVAQNQAKIARALRYLLREKKKDLTGIFSIAGQA